MTGDDSKLKDKQQVIFCNQLVVYCYCSLATDSSNANQPRAINFEKSVHYEGENNYRNLVRKLWYSIYQ